MQFVLLVGVENVKIINGKIQGDKEEHEYERNSTHEWGFGIDIRGSKNVELSNLEIFECTGDGVFITNYENAGNVAENITLNNLNIHDCRRQGISVIAANNIYIQNNEIHDIKGAAPQSGIDLESWDTNQSIDNVYIRNNKMYNIENDYAIIVMGNSRNVSIESNQLDKGISCDNIKEKLIISENEVSNGNVLIAVTDDGLSQGKIINKAVVKENNLFNSNIYLSNAKDVWVEENVLINKGIMTFNSNACFLNNIVKNESDTYLIAGFYSRTSTAGDIAKNVNLYLYGNTYEGKMSNAENIEESEMIVLHRNEEEILEYKKEFE